VDRVADVLIKDGLVAAIEEKIPTEDAEVFDCTNLVVSPGLIDLHVHLRVPGQEYKEDIQTGTAAAAAGGFTAFACQPNTVPPIDHPAIVNSIIEQSKNAAAHVYVIAAVSKGLQHRELAEIADLQAAGAVGIGDDAFPVQDSGFLRRAMDYCAMMAIPYVAHCEDKALTGDGVMNEGYWSTVLGLRPIPRSAENIGTVRNIILAEETGCHLHVLHVSTKESVQILREAKKRGAPVTCETCPQYCSLTDAECDGYVTNAKMSPPLRTKEDVAAILEGLRDGTIDAIATDHAPHASHEKEREFALAPFGMIGLETALGLVVTYLVNPGVLTLAQAIEKMSTAPARILGIPGGTLAVGSAADVSVFDPMAEWTVEPDKFKSKSRNTPLGGRKLKGQAVVTIVGGRVTYNRAEAQA
jgi:dihydroorotase